MGREKEEERVERCERREIRKTYLRTQREVQKRATRWNYAKIKDEYIPFQRLDDLLPTLDDAQTIYKFMDHVLCKGLRISRSCANRLPTAWSLRRRQRQKRACLSLLWIFKTRSRFSTSSMKLKTQRFYMKEQLLETNSKSGIKTCISSYWKRMKSSSRL